MAIYCLWTIQRQHCMTAWHFQIRWDVLGRRFKISGPVGLAYISINPIYSYFIFKNMNSCWFPIATTGPLLFFWLNCSSFYSNNSQSCNYNNKIWHWCSWFWQQIYWNAIIHRFNKNNNNNTISLHPSVWLQPSLHAGIDEATMAISVSKPSIHTLPPFMQPLDHTDVR